MDQKGNRPVEEEFRASQLYKILHGSGVPVADKVADGLNLAAETVDNALNSVAPTVKRSVTRAQQSYPGGRSTPTQSSYRNPGAVYQSGSARQTVPGQAAQPVRQTARQPAQQAPINGGGTGSEMKLVRKSGKGRFYFTAAAALLYAGNFPLYEPIHYIFFVLAVIGAYYLGGKIFKGKQEWVPVEAPKPKAEEKPKEEPKKEEAKPSQTGNPEVDKIIDEGNQYLKKLRAANDAIPDETLSEDIERMEKASADIFRYIADHPNKAPQIHKFMSYYLPTTLKLLNSYQRLSRQSAKGENITSTMFNIAGMMHTVADAFEKQLDALFTDEAMDVSADISVFETLLQQEGFVENQPLRRKKSGADQEQ